MRLNVRVEFAADTMVPLEQTATMVEFADTMVPSITDSPSHLASSSLYAQHTSATNTNTTTTTTTFLSMHNTVLLQRLISFVF